MNPKDLREATRAQHESVEGSVPLMRDNITREEYIAVLQRMYGVIGAWEEWLHQHAPAEWWPLLQGRERLPWLVEDLKFLGAKVPENEGPSLDALREMAGLIGGMYVMEGSTLGSQLIARHIEKVLHLTKGHGNSFFNGRGEQTGAMWKDFCALLETVEENEAPKVIAGARTMFRIFEEWMRQTNGPA